MLLRAPIFHNQWQKVFQNERNFLMHLFSKLCGGLGSVQNMTGTQLQDITKAL